MTQIFSDAGAAVPVTVIEAGPCPVTQIRNRRRGRLQRAAAGLRRGEGRSTRRARNSATRRRRASITRRGRSRISRRVDGRLRGRPGADRRSVRARRQDQGDGHDEGARLPGCGQAPRVPWPAGEPRSPEEAQPGIDRAGHEPVARDQGQEDARTDGRVRSRRCATARGARRCGAEPDLSSAVRYRVRATAWSSSARCRAAESGEAEMYKAPVITAAGESSGDRICPRCCSTVPSTRPRCGRS
jgi:hypothetical protein